MRTLLLDGSESGMEKQVEGEAQVEKASRLVRAQSKSRKSSSAGLLHRVLEPPLEKCALNEEYDVRRVLAEGGYARVLLARHRAHGDTVVLKAVFEELTSLADFSREFHYSRHLSPHPAVVDTYAVSFRAEGCLVFAQEAAPLGDLAAHVRLGGLPAPHCASLGAQLASALGFMHSKQLVHRDLKPENVLVFTADLSKVKLCDFGATRRESALVSKLRCNWLPFLPPEIYETVQNERYACKAANDTWQLGVLLFVCLTGCPPWQMADAIQDPHYAAFCRYRKRRTAKVPPPFKRFTPRALRMFRRLFEHKTDNRAPVTEVLKYVKDVWLEPKVQTSSSCSQLISASTVTHERKSSLNLSFRQAEGRHSQENNKNKLNKLQDCQEAGIGAEGSSDQKAVSRRVWEWVLSCDTGAEATAEHSEIS